MQTPLKPSLPAHPFRHSHRGAPGGSALPLGFTLIETVIAIGVVAVLLTGFLVVFTPAAQGIRRSISIQEADRLASTLEQEMVTLRPGEKSADIATGFDKAFEWIKESNNFNTAMLVYQYRGSLGATRPDDSPEPIPNPEGLVAGKDYTVTSIVRRKGDTKFLDDRPNDLEAIEGGVYLVKCTQLVFDSRGKLVAGTGGQIKNPKPPNTPSYTKAEDYPEAVIAFSAEFYALPGKSKDYFGAPFQRDFNKLKKPVFTRNLAVRR